MEERWEVGETAVHLELLIFINTEFSGGGDMSYHTELNQTMHEKWYYQVYVDQYSAILHSMSSDGFGDR